MGKVFDKKVPDLRFPGFSANWKLNKLGEVLKVGSGKDYKHLKKGVVPVFGTGGYMLSVDTALHSGESVFIGRKGTIDKPFYYKGDFWTVDTLFYTYDFLGITPKFTEYSFQRINWQKYNEASGVPSLSKKTIENIDVVLPGLEEQQKIADFLLTVDQKVEQLTRKKELLERYKKGVMHKIFNQEIRFKDENGNNFPDWVEKRLEEIGDIIGGGTPDTTKGKFWEGDINWFTPTEIKKKYLSESKRKISEEGYKSASSKLLPIGTVLLTTRATIGDVAITTQEAATNQGFQNIVVNKQNHNEFLYYWLLQNKKDLLRRANGSTFPEISSREIKKLKGFFPSLSEQQKIAEFLLSIDQLINLKQQQIIQTENWKKGLMQRLFV